MDKLLVASRIHSERTSPPLQASGFWTQIMQPCSLVSALVWYSCCHSLPSLLIDGRGGVQALSLLFRIAALGLSVAAVVVVGTASQLVIVDGSPES
jgi:hypothetical protein